MNPWLGSGTPDMLLLRSALRSKRRQMRALRPDDLPLVTANFSESSRSIPVGGGPGTPSVYVDPFNAPNLISDTSITGFLDLMLTSRPAEPGYLVVRPRPESQGETRRPVDTSLTYHLNSHFPLKQVLISLRATAPTALGATNSMSVSTHELAENPDQQVEQTDQDMAGTLQLQVGPEILHGSRDLFVTVRMTQQMGSSDNLSHRLDQLLFECENIPPAADSIASLDLDQYGNILYRDDFTTDRWKYFGEVQTSAKTHGGYRNHEFWVGMKRGTIVST